jgi:hypothetical protein
VHKSLGKTKEEIRKHNQDNLNYLIESFTSHDTKVEIISAESLYHFDIEGLTLFQNFLKKYFLNIKIVGYIRSPKSFMESSFQQLVKNHRLSSFHTGKIYAHYKTKLEKFDIVFGRENVNLWKFETSLMPNNNVIYDFCEKINIKYENKVLKKDNKSLSCEAIAILYTNNKYTKFSSSFPFLLQAHNILVKKLTDFGSKKFKFSDDFIYSILLHRTEDIKWIEKRLGTTLQEHTNSDEVGINSEKDLLQFNDKTVDELKVVFPEYICIIESTRDSSAQSISELIDNIIENIIKNLREPNK